MDRYRSMGRSLKEGGTTGNTQIDQRLKDESAEMARRNPKAANIYNNFEGVKTEREMRQRWPHDA